MPKESPFVCTELVHETAKLTQLKTKRILKVPKCFLFVAACVIFAVGRTFFMPYSSQLLADLDAVYKEIVTHNAKEGIIMNRLEICEVISRSPAPRLYISPEKAHRLTFNFEKNSARRDGREHRASAKHAEFYRRYMELPANMRSYHNICRILEQPAPSFYLSPHRISKLLYKVYEHDRRK